MKCIRYYRQHGGHVVRVNDDEAAREVADARAIYAPKHWWKAARSIEDQGLNRKDGDCERP